MPYLVLALGILLVQPVVSWYRDYTSDHSIRIEYLPEGASTPVVYQVAAEDVVRMGECITFPPKEDKREEKVTLCSRYQELP